MILAPEALVAGYPFIARRHGRVALCDPSAIEACCLRARELADAQEALEPAAIFYAFADKRRAFPFAWKLMALSLARRQAQANGLTVHATDDELGALCVDVLYRRAGWDEVRRWFEVRLHAASPR